MDIKRIPSSQYTFHGGDKTPELLLLVAAFAQTDVAHWVTGLLPAASEELTLFFGDEKDNAHIAKYPYTPESLDALESVCQKASFGRGQEEVLDESYRKAGKLDFGKFAWVKRLDDLDSIIKDGLIPFEGNDKQVRYELYKLNVYGKGSFFKSHKDTPRGDTMFGSLVFILPSPHEGGELVLKHDKEEYVFDAAAILKNRTNSIAYAAFYSDVDHEVREVIDGHRVTITYNLYTVGGFEAVDTKLDGTNLVKTVPVEISGPHNRFFRVFKSLLSLPTFLPEGGLLGFALQHLYPLPTAEGYRFSDFSPQLKGVDAIVAQACRVLRLKHALRIVYSEKYSNDAVILTKSMVSFADGFDEEDVISRLMSGVRNREGAGWGAGSAVLVHVTKSKYGDDDSDKVVPVHWITQPNSALAHEQVVPSYGNEPSVAHVYSRFALIVGVGKPGDRGVYGEIPPLADA